MLSLNNSELLSPASGAQKVAAGALLLDVRTPEEFAEGHVTGALNIPYDTIADRLAELGLDHNREIIVYCHAGVRAAIAQDVLVAAGFVNTFNTGGYDDWLGLE